MFSIMRSTGVFTLTFCLPASLLSLVFRRSRRLGSQSSSLRFMLQLFGPELLVPVGQAILKVNEKLSDCAVTESFGHEGIPSLRKTSAHFSPLLFNLSLRTL